MAADFSFTVCRNVCERLPLLLARTHTHAPTKHSIIIQIFWDQSKLGLLYVCRQALTYLGSSDFFFLETRRGTVSYYIVLQAVETAGSSLLKVIPRIKKKRFILALHFWIIHLQVIKFKLENTSPKLCNLTCNDISSLIVLSEMHQR